MIPMDPKSHLSQDHVTDVILNALEDVRIIVNQLRVMNRRLDAGIAFLTEVSGESFRTQNVGEENGPLDTTEPTGTLSESTSDEMKHDAVFMKETWEVMSASEKTNDDLCETTPPDCKEYLKMNDEREKNEKSKHDVVTVGYIYIIYLQYFLRFTFFI